MASVLVMSSFPAANFLRSASVSGYGAARKWAPRSEFWLAKTCRNATISTIMKKEIRLNAFAMNCVAHQSPGLWTHEPDRTTEYNRLPYWIHLAQTLERGRFDGLFLADVLGVYDVFGGSPDAALRNAAQTPANDPLLLIPAMATVTTSPTNIWRWSTSSGKEAGRTTRHCAIAPVASSPIPPRCIVSGM